MTIETESSGETAGNQAVRHVRTITQAVRHFAWGGRANGNQLVPQAEANVVSQNLLVSTSRKEISWCNKARLRGASTSRARAKVWALSGAGPWAGAQGLGARAPRGLGPGPQSGLGLAMTSRIKGANTGQWVRLCSDLARNQKIKTAKNAFIIS